VGVLGAFDADEGRGASCGITSRVLRLFDIVMGMAVFDLKIGSDTTVAEWRLMISEQAPRVKSTFDPHRICAHCNGSLPD
jgi:hypothetical protein